MADISRLKGDRVPEKASEKASEKLGETAESVGGSVVDLVRGSGAG